MLCSGILTLILSWASLAADAAAAVVSEGDCGWLVWPGQSFDSVPYPLSQSLRTREAWITWSRLRDRKGFVQSYRASGTEPRRETVCLFGHAEN